MLTMMTNPLVPTATAMSHPLTCRRAASSPQPPSTPPHTCCPKQTVVCVQNSISRCFAKNWASQICCHTCKSPLFALKGVGDLPENVHKTRPILLWMFSLDNYFAFTIYIDHAVCMLFVHWRCSKGQSPSLLIRMSASQSPQIATD